MTDEESRDEELTKSGGHELDRQTTELSRRGRSPVSSVAGWLLLLAGVTLLVMLWGNFRDGDAQGSVSTAGVQQLRISSGSTRVEFAQGSSEQVEVELTGRTGNRQLDVNRTGDTLDIRVSSRWWLPGLFSFGGSTLTVTVPPDLQASVDVNAGSGRVEISDVSLASVTVASSSGQVCLRELTVSGDLQVSTSSGRACLRDSDVRGTAELSTSSGAITVSDTTAASFALTSSSGSIEATGLPGTALAARTSSGSMQLEAVEIVDDWNLQSSSGRVRVELDERPDNLTIDFQGGSGRWNIDEGYGFDLTAGSGNRLEARIGTGQPELRVRTSSGGFSLD